MIEIKCSKCGHTSAEEQTTSVKPTICSTCLEEEAIETKLTYLKGLQGLSIKKRIAKIEAYIYEDSIK